VRPGARLAALGGQATSYGQKVCDADHRMSTLRDNACSGLPAPFQLRCSWSCCSCNLGRDLGVAFGMSLSPAIFDRALLVRPSMQPSSRSSLHKSFGA
jgi:hypothetical protein